MDSALAPDLEASPVMNGSQMGRQSSAAEALLCPVSNGGVRM